MVHKKDKSAKYLVDAVAYIFTTYKKMSIKIQGDKGKEFMKDHRVHFKWNVSKERLRVKTIRVFSGLFILVVQQPTTVSTE